MGGLIDKCKYTISDMIYRIKTILEKNEIDPESVLMKIGFYRNYPDVEIYGASLWENNPTNLIKFLNSIEATGGNGCREAVEVGLLKAV
jgi:hypothetical protein